MEDKEALQDKQLDEVTGGALADDPKSGKKSLIRSMYDSGSEMEIGMEKEIVKIDKVIENLLHPKK
ncbi:MAG: hypothetical protein J6Z15_05980 [Oscillospiraceae bacterium]|nr:hypothetical protein [Oscillospiraceae bacterium]MBO7372826.1 hypothetical protein [Oscillospiraceae bacterium]MBP5240113.1 hypothetical protein [Oscillospiraceae bacterium]